MDDVGELVHEDEVGRDARGQLREYLPAQVARGDGVYCRSAEPSRFNELTEVAADTLPMLFVLNFCA